jgi:hypothetical protein
MNVRDLLEAVAELDTDNACDEYLMISSASLPDPAKVRWWSCYAVKGGSEGWYLHVDAIIDNGNVRSVRHILTGKGWSFVPLQALASKVQGAIYHTEDIWLWG